MKCALYGHAIYEQCHASMTKQRKSLVDKVGTLFWIHSIKIANAKCLKKNGMCFIYGSYPFKGNMETYSV